MIASRTVHALDGWRDGGDGMLAERLATALERAALEGRVANGSRLPSERDLAAALSVGRATVGAAYGLLRSGGWLQTRRGAGSVVAIPHALRHGLAPSDAVTAGDGIDLRRAAPAAPIAAYRDAMLAAVEALTPELTLSVATQSVHRLRTAVAERLSARGAPTVADEVLITSGAVPGLWLVLAALFPRAPSIIVESPTYPLAVDAVRQRTGRLAGWPVTDGWDADEFERLAREHRAVAAYVIPDFHNPTGRRMSVGERRALVDAADRLGVTLLVDETMTDIDLSEPATAVPPLTGGHVVVLGSLSKAVWDGLRVGWVRAERDVIERLAAHPLAAQVATAPLEQAVAAELLPRLDELLDARRRALRARRDHLLARLGEMPGIRVDRAPEGGLCAWATLERRSSARLVVDAARNGVLLDPGGRFGPTGGFDANLRLPFSLPSVQLDRALDRLAPLLDA
jgi:DNA-binding transcriptional MocR family regulator